MSNQVLPIFPGLAWNVEKKPVFSTVVKKSVSGREFRAQQYAYPLWQYKLSYEVLRAKPALTEMQQLAAFFNAHGGSYDSWLFDDPDDNAVYLQPIGVADGTATEWQLLRTFGGFTEPVFDVKGVPVVLLDSYPANMLAAGRQLSSAAWSKSNLTVNANVEANPVDGAVTVDELVDSSTAALGSVAQTVAVPDDTSTYTLSFWVKKTSGGTSKTFYVGFDFLGGTQIINHPRIDTDTGTFLSGGPGSRSITSDGAFWRVSLTHSNNGTGNTLVSVTFIPAVAPHGATATDGTQTGNAKVDGVKLEPGSVSTLGRYDDAYAVDAYGKVSFGTPPAAGTSIQWTGSYYWRCRFLQDQLGFNQFMRHFWDLRSLEFISVKP